jgi:hypothetical protein
VDAFHLYGSDYAAAKAAGNELKGLTAFFNATEKICFPLMALIDFLGVRVVAMSLLPITSKTHVYGTADGGQTVRNDNQTFADLIGNACMNMNLLPHVCGVVLNETKVLSTAADVEGHLGTDGRFYMVDFARVFPPTTPDPQISRGYLYQVFYI